MYIEVNSGINAFNGPLASNPNNFLRLPLIPFTESVTFSILLAGYCPPFSLCPPYEYPKDLNAFEDNYLKEDMIVGRTSRCVQISACTCCELEYTESSVFR
jgi:hypothetical protein